MSSVCRLALAIVIAWAGLKACRTDTAAVPAASPFRAANTLRVCADPNNLPYSNEKQEGFENRIASLVAQDLGRTVEYFWAPQRRGFIRNTLRAHHCDVMMSVPAQYELARPTRPYYRSTYVFVSRRDRHVNVASFDDPRLRRLTIGVQITGTDYANPPAAQALAARHITANIRGYTVYGDYSRPDPQRDVVDAVAKGDVDVAIVWGPLAGYYAQHEPVAIDLRPVEPQEDGPALPFTFAISMGVRREDVVLQQTLDDVIARCGAEIRRILRSFGVPMVERSET